VCAWEKRRGVGWVCHSDPKIWASSPFAIPAAATTVIEIEKGRKARAKEEEDVEKKSNTGLEL